MIKTQTMKHQLMRIALICCFALMTGLTTHAQTIPNPNFEVPPGICPNNGFQLFKATGWSYPTAGSSQYYNCGISPTPPLITSSAQSGTGFMGQYIEEKASGDYKAYATTSLTSPMVTGRVYIITFYLKFPVGTADYFGFTYSNELLPVSERGFYGLLFSTTAPTAANTTNGAWNSIVNSFPGAGNGGRVLIPSSNSVYSTANTWRLITLSYTAVGGEQYMTVGQFRPGATSISTPQGQAEAYVDNFSIVPVVVKAPLTKSVSPASITDGSSAAYTFKIANTASGNFDLTGISFTDALPSGLKIATVPNITVIGLTGGTTTATAGGNSITASGYSLAEGTTGTITVNVTNVVGQYNVSCGANPVAFTNGAANITSISSNLNNNVGNICLTVVPATACP